MLNKPIRDSRTFCRSGLAFELSISIYAHRADLIGYARRICALSTGPTMADGKTFVLARSSRERVKASVVKSSAYPTRMKSVRRDFIARERNGNRDDGTLPRDYPPPARSIVPTRWHPATPERLI